MSDHAHDSHTGPIKTPAQLLWTSFFSFVAPIFIIIGLVYYVTSGDKPAAGAVDPELATAQRIQRVGTVVLGDAATIAAAMAVSGAAPAADGAAAAAPTAALSGEALYNKACVACHAAGVAGAPKFGDKAAWGPRIGLGLEALTASAIKGKGAMPPKGGSTASDAEIQAAVEFILASVK
ncbi:MAG: cytochrome c5 family protein [Hydrogenophaga sp.]|nr:cytochrome c5 family protein [Hydrogenophaga sp.]